MKRSALFILLLSLGSRSQVLTLHEAQEKLFENNLEIISSSLDVSRAKLELSQSRSQLYPSLDLAASYNYLSEKSKLDIPIGAPVNLEVGQNAKTDMSLHMTYPIFTGSSRFHFIHSNEYNLAAKESSLSAERNRASFLLGNLYLMWDFSFKQQQIRKEAVERYQVHSKKMKDLYAGEMATPVMVLQAQAALEAAQVDYLDASEQVDSLTRELILITGYGQDSIKPQQELLLFDSIRIPDTVDSTRAEIVAINYGIDQLGSIKKATRGSGFPHLWDLPAIT